MTISTNDKTQITIKVRLRIQLQVILYKGNTFRKPTKYECCSSTKQNLHDAVLKHKTCEKLFDMSTLWQTNEQQNILSLYTLTHDEEMQCVF